MSGGHATSSASNTSGGIHLGSNLGHAGKHAVNVAKNTAYNFTDGVYTIWKRVTGQVGDILIKKPVSATLHLAGGPVAKILDTTATGVSKVLGAVKLGHGKRVKPTAWLLGKINSLVASGVDTIANVDPTWTEREFHGLRGYFKHVGKKIQKNGQQLKAWKETKREARRARRAAVASAVTGHSVAHHTVAETTHDDHAHESHSETKHEHKEEKHDHSHADTHSHKAEKHHETPHETKKEEKHAPAHDTHAHEDSHTSDKTHDDHHASTADDHAHDDHSAKPAH